MSSDEKILLATLIICNGLWFATLIPLISKKSECERINNVNACELVAVPKRSDE